MIRFLLPCMLLAGMLMLAACGGSSPMSGAVVDTEAQLSGSPDTSGLPSIEELAQDQSRSLSIAGPGWYTLDLQYRNFGGSESGVTDDLPAIDIAAAGSSGFCVFGVHGFDGDAYPTGLRADVSDVVGEYYLLHTSYADGRWVTAGPFTESTTYEYPEVTPSSDPGLLTSSRTNHFVAILVPQGSSLQLDMLQLGVHGGESGPAEVLYLQSAASEEMLSFTWEHSTSYLDPDFAGYTVERRPWPGGSFTALTTEPVPEPSYSDDTAELGKIYLYRVVSWDTAGNSAPSYNFIVSRQPGQSSPPVVVVDMPHGPLLGPVEVTVDLSGSYDNDGDAITDYSFDFGSGIPPVTQPGASYSTILQPGCYSCVFTVKSGGITRSRTARLKVYPQWETTSHLVAEGTEVTYRNFAPRSFYDPQSGKDVFIFYDISIPALVSLTVDGDGNVDRSEVLTLSEGLFTLPCKPVFSNGVWSFLLTTEDPDSPGDYRMYMCTWQDNQIELQLATGNTVKAPGSSLVSDGNDGLYGLYFDFNIGYDIRLVNFANFSSVNLVTGLLDSKVFDAVWNPDAEAIDLLYSGSGSVDWLRWSPVIGPVAGANLLGVDSNYIELELDPSTGRPVALIHDQFSILHTALNADDTTWTVPSKVDPVDNDLPQCRLLFRDGSTYCAYGDTGSGTRLYRFNGVTWDIVNTADHPNGGGYCAMEYIPGVPGFHVVDVAGDLRTRLTLLQEDDSEQVLWSAPGWKRNAVELNAAGGSGGLHVLHHPASNFLHYTSPDGVNWTETTDAGNGEGGRIAADENGEVYATIVNGGNVYLRHWVDPAWVDIHDNPVSAGSLPFIFGQGKTLLFGSFDGNAAPDEFHYKRGANPADLIMPQTTAIWDGALCGHNEISGRILVRYGGMDFGDGAIGILDGSGEIEPLFGCDLALFDYPWTYGRHMEGAVFNDMYGDNREVFYVAYGPEGYIVRASTNNDVPWKVDLIPGAQNEYNIADYVRSISATTAWGDTAVGLGTNLLGKVFFFEWDGFGEFEQLPWPASLEDSALHELVVGVDGRWHIIYRDNASEDIRIISTIS